MGVYNLKKNALICVRMQNLNGIMLGAAILCTNLKAQMKIPVCVKKKMLKNPMNVEAGIDEKRKSNRIIREKRQKIKAILGTSKTRR